MAAHNEMQLCLSITGTCCPATLQLLHPPASPAAAAASMDSVHIRACSESVQRIV